MRKCIILICLSGCLFWGQGWAEMSPRKKEQIEDAIFWGNASRLRTLVRGEDLSQFGEAFLHSAVFFKQTNVIRILVDAGAPIDATAAFGRTPLMSAVNGPDFSMALVRTLVELGADINAVDRDGMDVLTYASEHGNTQLMTYLMAHGGQLQNSVCSGNNNPIIMAASGGNLTFLQSAVTDVRRFINNRGAENRTALMLAAKQGRWSTYRFLLEQGADVNLSDAGGDTLLMHAIEGGDIRIIRDLLDKGQNVNHFNNHRDTPLSRAIWKSRPDIIKLLMERGADASLRFGPFNRLPIDQAMGPTMQRSFRELVKHLNQDQLWEGFNLVTTGVFRRPEQYREFVQRIEATPERRGRLMAEAGGFGDTQSIQRLINMGVDINSTDGISGENALMKAANRGQDIGVRFLLRQGARFDQRNADGDNALHLAAQRGNESIISILVRAGMNPDEHDQRGNTPLHHAIRRGDVAAVNTLLRVGAQINHPGEKSRSPLFEAASLGKIAVLERLVRDADLGQPDVEGNTALGLALQLKRVDVARVLLAACAPLENLDSSGTSPENLLAMLPGRADDRAQIEEMLRARQNNRRCR